MVKQLVLGHQLYKMTEIYTRKEKKLSSKTVQL
jgi:hypothetical protein